VPPSVPPPRPRFALLPRPLPPGARAVMAISRGKPRQGVVGLAAVSLRGSDEVQELARTWLFPRVLPVQWTVVAIAIGGGADGEGASPRPCLCLVSSASRPNSYRLPSACNPLPAGGYPYVPPQSPCPREGGQYVGIPGKSRLMGCKPLDSVKKDRYSPPLRVPVIENRCTSAVSIL